MTHHDTDTIASLSTATPAALGVIRLSGTRAKGAVSALFRPIKGGVLEDYPPRTMVFGTLTDKNGKIIDQVLATYSNAPNTYTGEDTAEVHCHGSPMLLTMALEGLFAQGCRQSLRGEFTQRSFLNGKLDLAQAEGVADLIEAVSESAVHQAVSQLGGALSQKTEEIYQGLTQLMSHFCAVLDYPDEEIDQFDEQTIQTTLQTQQAKLHALKATWERGRRVAHGIETALVGLPNAGKSSLFNCLLGYERAIVTDQAGTTRDTIEGEITIASHRLRLVDTAGIRDTEDTIEKMGVARSQEAWRRAELVLLVVDGSKPITQEETQLIEEMTQENTIIILNKSDISDGITGNQLENKTVIQFSAHTGEGIDTLQNEIKKRFDTNSISVEDGILTNLRQMESVERGLSHVEGALQALEIGLTADAVLTDVEGALYALGQLTGRNVAEDITADIFARFCVGK